MQELTQELIQSLFNYRDGILYWKNLNEYCHNRKNGDKAGYIHHSGYQMIGINNKYYQTHRLIFLYHNNYLPKIVDHIDGNKSNNKIENLREVTQSQNCMNKKSDRNSSSKYKGVSWRKTSQKWRSRIQINGKQICLGSFESEKTAAFIYNVYARGAFGKYANLNKIQKS